MLVNDDAGTLEAEAPAQEAEDAGERRRGASTGLPWLFPWLLAFTGILITLALMR
jgi:hypothetical protein